jgi:hypothetical protein
MIKIKKGMSNQGVRGEEGIDLHRLLETPGRQ